MLYSFEDCVLDTRRRELRRGTGCVDIEPQVFDLLEFLIRTRDRVASRNDILEAVWRGRIVSESTLSSRINAARTAIGDDGAAQRLIKTLPRKGFRFVGTVREEQESSPRPESPAAAAVMQPAVATTDGPAIAVLPFTNMSGDPESDYFADGMADEIITALSHCSGIWVIARSSSFTYKGRAVDIRQIGRELGVGYVLEGSVRRGGDRLRITAQLIEAAEGTHIWADRFDGSLDDVFELQDRIAATTVAVIEPRLRFAEVERAKRTPPKSMDAYDLWLRAVSLASEFTAESMASAIRHLEQALAIDPTFALAMATTAYYHAQCQFQGWVQRPEQIRTRATRLAWDAIELAKDDANVLWQSAFAIWTFEQDRRAHELFRRALEINPNSAIALTLAGWLEAGNGRPAEGRKLIERAQRLSPCHPRAWFMLTGTAIVCIADEKYEEAVTWAEKALIENPRFAVALRARAVALVNIGQIDRAKEAVAELLRIDPRWSVSKLRRHLRVFSEPMSNTYCDALRKAGLPE